MDKNAKIAITGATGMVGTELTLALARAGYTDLTVLVRDMEKAATLTEKVRGEGFDDSIIRVIMVTLADYRQMKDVLRGVEVVFNCAASISLSGAAGRVVANNIDVTASVVEASLACGVRRLVHVSSIAALGRTGDDKLITEKTHLETIEGQSTYAISKFLSEKEVIRGSLAGLQTVIVNPAVIIGEGFWRGSGSGAIVPFISSGFPLYLDGVTGYVDVRDVAAAMIALAESPDSVGKSFILSAANLSYGELLTLAARAAGKKPPRIHVGNGILNAAAGIGKFLSWFGERSRFIHFLKHTARNKCRYDGSRVTRVTGFKYTPIEETINRVVKAYKQQSGQETI